MDNNETKIELLQNNIKTARKIKTLVEDISQLLKIKDDTVLDPLRPIIEPRKNACAVLDFYNKYLNANKRFNEFNKQISTLKIEERFKKNNLEIECLHNNNILELLNEQMKILEDLENYREINIIKKITEKHNDRINCILEIIRKISINSLKRLPKVVDYLDLYSRFILKHSDPSKYLREYTEICHSRLGFFGIENNEKAILQQTKNLTEYFNMIKELNTRIIGQKFSKTVNNGLIKLIVLDLKNILGTILMKIDKNQSSSNIPFLIQLYSRIRHSDGNMVEEIEDLFELKPEIMKIMFNCFIQFFGELDLITKPRKDLVAESLIKILSVILEQFKKHADVKKEWFSRYGSSFGVYKIEDVDSNFCEKSLLKITELSETLDKKLEPIYMLNNIHQLNPYFSKFSGLDIKQLVYKYCEIIIGFLRIGVESVTPDTAQEYVRHELDKMKKYFLHEEERKYVNQKIRVLVEDLVSRKLIQGNPKSILEDISKCFSNDSINKKDQYFKTH